MTASFLRDETGQTATEYMLVFSVLALAAIAATWVFVPQFRDGLEAWGSWFEGAYADAEDPYPRPDD